jgi:hypothetical protein
MYLHEKKMMGQSVPQFTKHEIVVSTKFSHTLSKIVKNDGKFTIFLMFIKEDSKLENDEGL